MKTLRIWVVMGMVVILLLGISVQAQEEGSQEDSARLLEQIDNLEQVTIAIRGLEERSPVSLSFPSREDVVAYIDSAFRESVTDEELAELDAFYKAFGFVPADYNLLEELIALYSQQVAGYYDTDTKEMNVILTSGQTPAQMLPILEQITYVHEYVHALQDQHFDLAAYTEALESEENSDLVLAKAALVEGDASAVMNEYTALAAQENPLGTLLGVALGGLRSGNLTLPPGIPDVIANELIFPYVQGEVFVRALYSAGGWDLVNAAYTNPPQSTEHVLYPQTYLDGDVPQTVTLDGADAPADWTLVDQGVFGVFYLQQWLQSGGNVEGAELSAVDAAAGWGGDAYHVYRSADGSLAWALRIAWDRPDDAANFVSFLQSQAEQRTGTAFVGEEIACAGAAPVLCMQVSDSVLLVQAANQATAETLLMALAQ